MRNLERVLWKHERPWTLRAGSWPRTLLPALLALLASVAVRPGSAEVVRFEIQRRVPFADGRSFAEVGPYEQLIGTVYFALDPKLPQNREIVDLELASRNAAGKVEASADLFILAPAQLQKGNGAVLYDVNNRGNKLALRFFNDTGGGNQVAEHGNGFLMRQGYTIVWSGWNGELLPGDGRLQLHAPTTARPGGDPVTGVVRYEIVATSETRRVNVNRENHGAYRPTPRGLETARLTWRLRPGDPRVPIPRTQFRLHVSEVELNGMGQLPMVELELPAGLQRGYLYELTYEAQDPLVHGICFASVRDLISALKRGAGEGNPLVGNDGASSVERAYGFGVSQSGRFLREFLYWGFNEDVHGARVFEGLMPHVAGAGLGSFHHRFAQPSAYASQHEHHDWPTDRFPFTYATQYDPVSRREDGILRRASASGTVPFVLHSQSSTEYWSRSGSLVHTDPRGQTDAKLPDTVRVYAFGGTQHSAASFPPKAGAGQTRANPADYQPLLRALLTALDAWCRDAVPAPTSVHPTIAKGTLVDWRQDKTGFPRLPGIRYPEVIQQPAYLDLGPRWDAAGIIDHQPPPILDHYQVLVPRCNRDGNEAGCLLPPEVAVPLATFSGWSLRSRETGAQNELVGLDGSYIPLPQDEAQRKDTGDPRRSPQERYGSLEMYLDQLEATCRQMVEQRYLLEEDVPRILARQQQRARKVLE